MATLGPIEELGTQWWFELFDCPEASVDDVYARLRTELTRFNNEYSRFKGDSVVGRLNNGETIVDPSPEFQELIQLGMQWYETSEGHFNFISGHIQEAQGYDAHYSFASSPVAAEAYSPRMALEITDSTISLRSGKIDFGGFGKGYLIDRLVTMLRDEFHLERFLINGGGDMYGASNSESIEVLIEHPTTSKVYIARVPLQNQALAVSSSFKRTWRDQTTGAVKNHFLDPTRSNRLIEGSSYIVAPQAITADTLATIATIAPTTVSLKLLAELATGYAVWPAGESIRCNSQFKSWLLTNDKQD